MSDDYLTFRARIIEARRTLEELERDLERAGLRWPAQNVYGARLRMSDALEDMPTTPPHRSDADG